MFDLDIDSMDTAQERRPVAPGEYPVVLGPIQKKIGKDSGKPYLNASLDIEGEDRAKRIYHMLSLPETGDPSAEDRKVAINTFCSAFDIDRASFLLAIKEALSNPEEDDSKGNFAQFEGARAQAQLVDETYNNQLKNKVKSFLSRK